MTGAAGSFLVGLGFGIAVAANFCWFAGML